MYEHVGVLIIYLQQSEQS